ncbi:MAG: ASKHA domain-containing protein [Clostridiales bacterium]|nr:ASKHA domain-containing protein [Clostridiales bacterium]
MGKNPLPGNRSCYAAVIDIGTTTVAYLLYKMPEGELVKSAVHKNSQSVFGADVVSRISYAESNAGNGVKTLQKRICDQIDNDLNDFGYPVDFRVVTGNTAMLHFYRGLSVNSLAKAPFGVNEYFGAADGEVCVPRCISAFVGADVTCGIISSGMLSDNCSMLIDIGTNGEIVLKNGSEFSCCSASAGPAFEGASISKGVASVSGAICSVFNVGSSFYYKTIGGEKPCGICGSGLIDAVASMLKADIVDKDGYLERDFYIGNSGISISPADIRAVQIAKAAIRAAIETICPDLSKVQNFYISGSFGSYLNIDNAILIGLFPREMRGKVYLCGNTAAAGASMMLLDKAQFEKGNEIARSTKTLTLASSEVFYEKYIRYLSF